jgi:hypothetical protein
MRFQSLTFGAPPGVKLGAPRRGRQTDILGTEQLSSRILEPDHPLEMGPQQKG